MGNTLSVEECALALHLGEVAVFGRVSLRRALDELEELPQAFAFGNFHLTELDSHAERGTGLSDDSVEDHPLDPDFSACYPQSEFDVHAAWHRSGSFDETPSHTGV
jgi:hypothetical protein